MENNKMMNTAKTLDIFAKVAGGIFSAVGFVCLVFAVLVLIFGEKMFVAGSLTLDLDFLKLHIAENLQAVTGMMKLYTVLGLLSAAVLLFVLRFVCLYLRAILNPMKEGRPFEADIPIYLRRTAWLCLGGGLAAELIGIAERVILARAYPMDQIFSSDAITKIEYVFTFDFGFVWIFVAFMFLSYVFSYGQKLQQEADETL